MAVCPVEGVDEDEPGEAVDVREPFAIFSSITIVPRMPVAPAGWMGMPARPLCGERMMPIGLKGRAFMEMSCADTVSMAI